MKKTTIILGVVVVVVLAGIFWFKPTANQGSNTPVASATPSPSPIQNGPDIVWGKITSLTEEKMVIVDERGNSIEIPLNSTVKYYEKQIAGTVVQKEIDFSSFHVGEWVAVYGTSYRESESKPIYRLVPGYIQKSQDPNNPSIETTE